MFLNLKKYIPIYIILWLSISSLYVCEENSEKTKLQNGLKILQSFFKKSQSHYNAIKPQLTPESETIHTKDVLEQCKGSDSYWFRFLGRTVSSFNKNGLHQTFTGDCFRDTTISANLLNDSEIEVNFWVFKKSKFFCTDTYVITSMLNLKMHSPIFEGHSKVIYKLDSKINELQVVKNSGLKVMKICESWWRVLPDLISTASMFIDMFMPTWVPKFISKLIIKNEIKKNYKFQKKYLNADFPEREYKLNNLTPDVLKMYIKSGDVLMTHNGTGFDTLILSLDNGPLTHSAIALWENQKLYVVEDDSGPGINKQTFESWYEISLDGGWNMVWLPQSEKTRAKFDLKKVWSWYYKENIEGSPYGMETALYGAFDLKDSTLPGMVDDSFFVTLLNGLSKIGLKSSTDILLTDGLNKRLGTNNQTIGECIQEIAKRKLDLSEVMAIPENSEWLYDGHKKLICSGMVIKFMKVAGVFDEFDEINESEFTPRDLFMMKVYEDSTEQLPWQCKVNNPGWKYCQIGGDRQIDGVDVYNSVEIHNGMAENKKGGARL